MSLYKRGSTWWIDFTTPSGERIRRSAETSSRVEAQELHDRLKAEHWRVRKLGERRRYTWDEAASKWLQETVHKRTHHEDSLKLDWLRQFLRWPAADSTDTKLRWKMESGGINGSKKAVQPRVQA
jgi:hypothetical protein